MRVQNRTAHTRRANASALHKKTFAVLRELFPDFTVTEEESLEVEVAGRKTTVFVDLMVRELNLAIECHGRQHFEYVEHFHGTQTAFRVAQQRDEAKAKAIIGSGKSYLVVRFDEEGKLTRSWLIKRINKAIKESSQ